MASTPIAYNTGSAISGTIQVGNLAVGTTAQPYCNDIGGVKWWMGPEESTGYVIGIPVSGGNQPTPISGVSASVGFYRSSDKTDNSFLSLTNRVFNQNFSNASSASTWLTSNGFWNTYGGSTTSNVFTVTVFQSGSDVVWYGEGGFDTSALTLSGSRNISTGYGASYGIWTVGSYATASVYSGSITFASNFGTDSGITASISSGAIFGILFGANFLTERILLVPLGYTSRTIISGSGIYTSQSIASMGLVSGSYNYSWGSGSTFSSIALNIG